MARIIVTTEESEQGTRPVFLEESVHPVHLSTEHAAMQLIERLNWALGDAEAAERVRPARATTAQATEAVRRERQALSRARGAARSRAARQASGSRAA